MCIVSEVQLQSPLFDLFMIHQGTCAMLDTHPGGLRIALLAIILGIVG